jgi:7,8-dihydroneopterin aldolase/epimerase/oxygenase
MHPPDTIEIRRLRVSTHIGVPDDERSRAQDLLITIRMCPAQGFLGLHDDIRNTIDYAAVASEIQNLAAAKPRHLIETLANDCASYLLSRNPITSVTITIEKHILPNTECVAVSIHRAR